MDITVDVDTRTCSSDGWVRIVGFGSLLAKSSAQRSFPGLRDWTLIRLPSCCRVFGHTAPIFYQRGIAQGREVASLSCEPIKRQAAQVVPRDNPVIGSSEDFGHTMTEAMEALRTGHYMCATAFYIPFESMKEFRVREQEFSFVTVQPYSSTSFAMDGRPAILCGRGSDALFKERIGGNTECGAKRWKEMVTDYGLDTLWDYDRETLLPCGPYLRLCVLAAEILGIGDNFLYVVVWMRFAAKPLLSTFFSSSGAQTDNQRMPLFVDPFGITCNSGRDTTFLANRKTSVREYLQENPSVMHTLAPESVRHFYTP